MQLRTRFAVFGAAALLAVSGFFAAGMAQAADDDGDPASPQQLESACFSALPTIVGGPNNDVLNGGPGADVIDARGGNDVVFGGGGADVILGSSGNDSVYAGDGDDLVCAGEDDDQVQGGDGNDTIYGEPGDDQMQGGGGQDWLIGQAHVFGDTGNGQAGVDACLTTEAQVSC
ncbi:calcium-binding protein [Flindersiella endophytica]